MGICVRGARLYWLQAEAHDLSSAIQETIERHEDGQGWQRGTWKIYRKAMIVWLMGFFYFTSILIVSFPFLEYYLVI